MRRGTPFEHTPPRLFSENMVSVQDVCVWAGMRPGTPLMYCNLPSMTVIFMVISQEVCIWARAQTHTSDTETMFSRKSIGVLCFRTGPPFCIVIYIV